MIQAALELGSNSIKLLVADVSRGRLREICSRIVTTRLAEGLSSCRKLSPAAVERTLKAIRTLNRVALREGAESIQAVGTEALRRATDRRKFVDLCRSETGILVRILSSSKEAELSFFGATGGKRDAVALDIGGASTEIMRSEKGRFSSRSYRTGVVLLTEKHIHSDPPSLQERESMARHIRRITGRISRLSSPEPLILLGGTASILGTMMLRKKKRPLDRLHGSRCRLSEALRLFDHLMEMPLARRKRVPGLPADRADVFPAGLALLSSFAEKLGTDSLRVSLRGLRHGLLLSEK